MSKERIKQLKQSSREMLDNIGTDTALEQKVIKMIYGFILAGFEECNAQRGGAV